MEKKLVSWYRRKYENIKVEPPGEVWEHIARSLDSPEKKRRRRIVPFIWIFFLVLLPSMAIYLGSLIMSRDAVPQQAKLSDHEKAIQEKPGILYKHADLPVNKKTVHAGSLPAIVEKTQERRPKDPILSRSKAPEQALNEELSMTASEPQVVSWELLQPVECKKLERSEDALYSHTELKESIQEETLHSRKFLLGVTIGYNNPWIINSNLFDATHKNSLNRVQPYYTFSYSALGGYQVRTGKTLLLEACASSFAQKYYSYDEGHVTNKELKLSYVQLNSFLAFKAYLKKRPHSVSYFSMLAGIHTGYLTSATYLDDGERIDQKGDYRKMNVGLLAGAAYTMEFGERYGLSLSLRSNLGVMNVYKGSEELPVLMNRTYNTDISTALSLYHKF